MVEKEILDKVYRELFMYGLIRRDTIGEYVEKLYPHLQEKASNKEMVDYDHVKEYIETSRVYIGRVLGAINQYEEKRENPFLTAIVVQNPKSANPRPSRGFFIWPCVGNRSDLKLHPDGAGEPQEEHYEFWENERDKVWEKWAEE